LCSGKRICASVVNETINRALTRLLTRHSNEDRFGTRFISHNASETLYDSLGLFGIRVVHQQADLSLAQHPNQI
jgi:hypothetical protein